MSKVDLDDVINLLNYVGKLSAHQISEWTGDVNCDHKINIGDVILLLNHVIDPETYKLGCYVL